MVYQKIMNLLDKHQINRLIYDKKLGLNKWWITWSVQHWQSNWIKNFNGAYTLVKGTITFLNTGTAEALDNRNKKVIFKNCAPFTHCINEINYKEIDCAKDIDVVLMPIYDLIEYSDNYLKTLGSLWQYYRDEPFINHNWVIIDDLDTKRYVPVVALVAQDNAKILQELKVVFNRTINLNKCQSDPLLQTRNRYLNYMLWYSSFQGVNIIV